MGKLYIVATPIGNLDDMTVRAREVLSDVAFIAAEDTRHTGILLGHLGLDTPMRRYHDFNEEPAAVQILDAIEGGSDVALVSDAGTPQISDPGYRLVRLALQRNVEVVPIPGASALAASLSVSGIPCNRFVFEGFLPSKQRQRHTALAALSRERRSIVFYEAPHRVKAMLQDMADTFGDREIMLARELTKMHEQLFMGGIDAALQALDSGEIPSRGEFVIMVTGAGDVPLVNAGHEDLMRELSRELPPAKAADIAARLTGEPRKVMYQLALTLKGDRGRA